MTGNHLHKVPVSDRPPPGIRDYLHFTTFNAFFALAMMAGHVSQLFCLPLAVLAGTESLFQTMMDWHKALAARLLVLVSSIWAPTVLRITVDSNDKHLDLREIIQRDAAGAATGIALPERMVLMANHQVYCDWTYIWCLLYFARLQSGITIALKASLKWAPLFGPAMQMFRFVFMQKNWEADKPTLWKVLARMGKQAKPFVLLYFPEGTLVSRLTRPVSAKFAEKMGIPDGVYTLLPRSTGLLFCLRSLAPLVPDLQLLDVTIAYPGIPQDGYGQDHYTLQSIFGRRVPPPIVHMHLRSDAVATDIPIGKTSTEKPEEIALEATPEEKKVFEDWLLDRFRKKDEQLELFYSQEKLAEGEFVDVPVRLRSTGALLVLLANCILGAWLGKWFILLCWRLIAGR